MGNVSGVTTPSIPAATEPVLFQKDSRGRLPLGQLATADRYLGTLDSEGRIVLEPAVVMTATEQRLLSDGDFVNRMTKLASAPASAVDLDDL